MPDRSKVLVAISTPSALKEMLAAKGTLELLALRDPQQLNAALLRHTDLAAVVVEHAADRRRAIELLQATRSAHPNVRRVVIADPTDLTGLFEGLSCGAIDEIVYRPVDPALLTAAVLAGAKPAPATAVRASA